MQLIVKKAGIVLLIGIVLTQVAPTPWTAISKSYAESAPTDKPKIWLSPEIDIKPEHKAADSALKDKNKEKRSWFARNKWWVLIGALAAGAAVALAVGGGDGGGEEEDNESGTYDVSW